MNKKPGRKFKPNTKINSAQKPQYLKDEEASEIIKQATIKTENNIKPKNKPKFNRKQVIQERSIFDTEFAGVSWSRKSAGNKKTVSDIAVPVKKSLNSPVKEKYTRIKVEKDDDMRMDDSDDGDTYNDIIGNDENFISDTEKHPQVLPMRLLDSHKVTRPEHLNSFFKKVEDNDELVIVQMPQKLPAFIYPQGIEDEPFQATCHNYPPGRFGTIQIWRDRETNVETQKFLLQTSMKNKSSSPDITLDVEMSHDTACHQDVFVIEQTENQHEIVLLGDCNSKIVCSPDIQ